MIESAAAMGLAPLEQYRMLFILLATLLALAILAYAFSQPEGSADQPGLFRTNLINRVPDVE